MSGIRLLKTAAWLLILLGAAHLFGHYQGLERFENPAAGKEAALISAMHGFAVGEGSGARSIAELYTGFSLFFSLASMLIGALVLAASRELASNTAALRRIAVLLIVALAAFTAVSAVYFIPPPTVFFVAALMAAAAAAIRLRQPG